MWPPFPPRTKVVSEILLTEAQKFFPVDQNWLEGSGEEGEIVLASGNQRKKELSF